MRTLDGSRRSLSICAAFALAVLVTSSASADGVAPGAATPEQKKEAMDHFLVGKQAFESRNWEKSIAELRASLGIVDSPNARLELARALRDSGALGEAWTEYGQVIDDATKLAATEERYSKTADAATSERTDVEAKLSFLIVTVVNAPPDAVLKVGGRVVPHDQWRTPVIAMPGAVDVVLADLWYWGGLHNNIALDILCTASGIDVGMHSSSEFGIGWAAMIHTACAMPHLKLAMDNMNLHLRDDIIVGGKIVPVGGEVAPPEGPGLGIEVDEEKLRQYTALATSDAVVDRVLNPAAADSERPGWYPEMPAW